MIKGYPDLKRRRDSQRSIATIIHILLTGLWLAWTTQPCAASQAPIQLAQSSSDLFADGQGCPRLG